MTRTKSRSICSPAHCQKTIFASMKHFIIAAALSSAFITTYAQEDKSWRLFPSKNNQETPLRKPMMTDSGSVQYIQDKRLDELLTKYNHNHSLGEHLEGFRIQIFSVSGANSRLKARNTLMEFSEKYPEIKAYLKFESPNFQVRVGDFRNRYEAEKVLDVIKKHFSSAFIKADLIELPPLEKKEKTVAP